MTDDANIEGGGDQLNPDEPTLPGDTAGPAGGEPFSKPYGSEADDGGEGQAGGGFNTIGDEEITWVRPVTASAAGPETADSPKRSSRFSPTTVVVAAAVSAVVALATSFGVMKAVGSNSTPVVIKQVKAAPTTLQQGSLSGVLNTPSILAKVEPAVVDITAQGTSSNGYLGQSQFQSAGTGMIISSNGLVLTNNHVIANATSIQATLYNQSNPHPVKVIGVDPAHDVAVLQIEGLSNLPTVTFGSSKQLQVGDPVVAIGNALALQGQPTVTDGIVSALHRGISTSTENLSDMIQTDAPINPGNSGGPLVDAAGQVVGMNTAIIASTGTTSAQGLGFAEAIDSVLPVIKNIEKNPNYYTGSSSASPSGGAFLGVGIQTLNAQTASQLGYPSSETGALIDYIYPGSPASQAGLAPGDVIDRFNSSQVADASALVRDVKSSSPGTSVTLGIQNSSGSSTVTVTLGTAPAT